MATQQYVQYDPLYVPGGFGFRNTSAICWGNSLIQFMLGIPAVSKTLLLHENRLASNAFATEYIKLIKLITPNTRARNGSIDYTTEHIDTTEFALLSHKILSLMLDRMKLKGIKSTMRMGEECADEAFTMFIDMLDCPEVEQLFSTVYSMAIDCRVCGKTASIVRDKTLKINMFTSMQFDTQSQFENYIRVHNTEHDSYKCDCGAVSEKIQRVEKLQRLSEVVVVVFEAFRGKTKRWFPPVMSFPSRSGTNLTYKLVGKIDHSGSARGGHYWAHSLRDEWLCLNDNATPSVGDPNPSINTFMIAYHMVSPDTK